MGRDRPVSGRREGKMEVIMKGRGRKTGQCCFPSLFFVVFVSLRRGKDVAGKKEPEGRAENERCGREEAAGIRCIMSSGGAAFGGRRAPSH